MAAEPQALKISVLHGPNLNLLGQREPEVYGPGTLEEIDGRLFAAAEELDVALETFQSNGEGELVERVHSSAPGVDGFLVNAGGYTHTSVALLDALVGVDRPFVEVHLSNLHARERFRRRSLLAPRAVGVVMGFGPESYLLGLLGLVRHLRGGAATPRANPNTMTGGA
ncbi:MAG TPA: type II 3-dehydroquinate dehydratase [Longimicrobiales bacterium]|nr:type II 3-dehydroquinate dehydratase [Longimicrobiales bacterium]